MCKRQAEQQRRGGAESGPEGRGARWPPFATPNSSAVRLAAAEPAGATLVLLASAAAAAACAMLAADKLLLQSNVKQRAIQLREKELNLFNDNFNAVGTQSAVLAGCAMTSFAEIDLPHNAFYAQKACLHLFVTISICANLMCTASTTFVSVWGSGKALRGKDGSMARRSAPTPRPTRPAAPRLAAHAHARTQRPRARTHAEPARSLPAAARRTRRSTGCTPSARSSSPASASG